MKTDKSFLLLIFVLILHNAAHCQNTIQDTILYKIETRDGNEFKGEIISEDSLKIQVSTTSIGVITIQKKNIKSIELIDEKQIRGDEIWFSNPQSTRYFWSPNGFGLKEGEGYYHNIWVLWNQFAVGITDNFSVGGGIIPLFLFGGTPTPIFITPKFSIPIEADKINIGAGALIGTILGETESSFGIVYGVSTFGTADNNVTFGLGYGFTGEGWASSPMLNFNGMFRLSERWYFLTENYYINTGGEGFGLLTLGGRWMIRKAALDFGLVLPIGIDDGFVGIPLLGFTVPFGKNF